MGSKNVRVRQLVCAALRKHCAVDSMQLEASCLSHALVSSPSVVAVSVEVQSQIDALLEQAFPEAVVSQGALCTSLVVDHAVVVSVTERSSGALAERSTPLDAIREQVLCGATPRVPSSV